MSVDTFQDMATTRRLAAVAIAQMCRDGDSHRMCVELEETIPGRAGALTEAYNRPSAPGRTLTPTPLPQERGLSVASVVSSMSASVTQGLT